MNELGETAQIAFTPIFHGLFYVDERNSRHTNLKGGKDPFDIYVQCAALCAASVAHHGYKFKLITNNKEQITRRAAALNLHDFEIVEHAFTLDVPKKIQFYSAHFKIEVISKFGEGVFGDHLGLIDIDTVMTAPIAFPPLKAGTLLGYDITDQMTAEYGITKIIADLDRVAGRACAEHRWLGGEFLFGHAESFRRLSSTISRIWPLYLREAKELCHTGDETLVSAAASSSEHLTIMDAGQQGLIARWWTARTACPQPPFSAIKNSSILHLPSDKPFLARCARQRFDPANLISAFEQTARRKLLARRIFNTMRWASKGEQRYVGRLN
jgi:hypothetical protein